MKKSLLQIATLIFIFSIISCTDYTTGSDVIKKVDFNKLNTYAWLPVVDSITVPNINTMQLNTYIFTAIDAQLTKRKLTVDTIKPDFLVRFSVIVNNSTAIVSTPVYAYQPTVAYGYGYYGSSMYYYNQPVQVGTQTSQVVYRNGTLIIEIIDHSINEVVWRGYAYQSKDVTQIDATQSTLRDRITQVVSDIFFNFPIKKKK